MKPTQKFRTVTFILMCMMLTSCTSAMLGKDDVAFAEKYAVEACLSNAQRNLGGYFEDSESFIPAEYSELEEYRDLIPGMNYLLERWRINARACVLGILQNFGLLVSNLSHNMSMPSKDVLLSSVTSLSESLKSQFSTEILEYLNSSITGKLDNSSFIECVNQYNIWTTISSENNNMEKLEYHDISGELARIVYTRFFDELSECEILFRKSKDPFNDGRVTSVFNMR